MTGETKCIGRCCESFHIPQTVERIRQGGDPDAEFIADMLVPLFTVPAGVPMMLFHMVAGMKFPHGDPGGRTDRDQHFYTCKHLDRGTGRCTVYARRPAMCSCFPDQGVCTYQGCSNGSGSPGVESRDAAAARLGRPRPLDPFELDPDFFEKVRAEAKAKADSIDPDELRALDDLEAEIVARAEAELDVLRSLRAELHQ